MIIYEIHGLTHYKMTHNIHYRISVLIIEEANKYDGEEKKLYLGEAAKHLLLMLKSTSLPLEHRDEIHSKFMELYSHCTAEMQSELEKSITGDTEQPLHQPQNLSTNQQGQNGDKMKIDIDSCKVTTFKEVPWDQMILSSVTKNKIVNNIIIPLKKHKYKLKGCIPGHLFIGASGMNN